MCLILLAREAHPQYSLIVAANRDEYYDRPAAPLGRWNDYPSVLAGRDLKSFGAWMGVTAGGRFAAVTNYRDPRTRRPDAPSRGCLVSDFLISKRSAGGYLNALKAKAAEYNDFNLLVYDRKRLLYFSSRSEMKDLGSGVFGLSNHLLDTPWPKVEKGKRGLRDALRYSGEKLIDRLMELLGDREKPPDRALPDTGVGLEWERELSPIFIETPIYGTRSSGVVLVDRAGAITFVERTFEYGKKPTGPIALSIPQQAATNPRLRSRVR